MGQSIYNMMWGNNNSGLIQKFNQFKKTVTGDPRQQVQELLNSGRMSQEQFNRFAQMADQFSKILK